MAVYIVRDYTYHCAFGSLCVSAEIEMTPEDFARAEYERSFQSVAHRIVNENMCLRLAAAQFYHEKYQSLMVGETILKLDQIQAIRRIMGLSVTQFSAYLGLKKGSGSNILKGRRVLALSTQILLVDKLAIELYRPWTSLNILSGLVIAPWDEDIKASLQL